MPEQPAPDPIDAALAAVKGALGAGAPVDAVLAELKAAILRAVSLSAAAEVQGVIAVIERTPVPPCAGDVFTGAAAMKECILAALRAHLVEQREGGVMARKTALALRARAEELEARLAAASGGREATVAELLDLLGDLTVAEAELVLSIRRATLAAARDVQRAAARVRQRKGGE